MIPSQFKESNANLNAPIGKTEEQVETLAVWRGSMDGEPRVISRWRPQRAEVEAMASGASVWLHVMGQTMPPVALGCQSPFVRVVESTVASPTDKAPISEVDPLELATKAAAMDAIMDMVLPSQPTATAEDVVGAVARIIHEMRARQ